ncbi:hypothetical protein Goshw_004038 [Gossypium schwendimanii]|uniref:Uncharacterized protein n=1 Tax=Gossypium schwendimanii TaxID=34291 RepID=A0A7J9M0Q3_GOSSC|nr:hypothetical protein [Gossypium schwendimanii]
MQCERSIQLGYFPIAWIHKVFSNDIRNSNTHYKEIQKFLCQLNKVITFEIWPPLDITAHGILVQHKPYHEENLKSQYEDKDEDFHPDAYHDAFQLEIYQKKQDRIIDLSLTLDESTKYD